MLVNSKSFPKAPRHTQHNLLRVVSYIKHQEAIQEDALATWGKNKRNTHKEMLLRQTNMQSIEQLTENITEM